MMAEYVMSVAASEAIARAFLVQSCSLLALGVGNGSSHAANDPGPLGWGEGGPGSGLLGDEHILNPSHDPQSPFSKIVTDP